MAEITLSCVLNKFMVKDYCRLSFLLWWINVFFCQCFHSVLSSEIDTCMQNFHTQNVCFYPTGYLSVVGVWVERKEPDHFWTNKTGAICLERKKIICMYEENGPSAWIAAGRICVIDRWTNVGDFSHPGRESPKTKSKRTIKCTALRYQLGCEDKFVDISCIYINDSDINYRYFTYQYQQSTFGDQELGGRRLG